MTRPQRKSYHSASFILGYQDVALLLSEVSLATFIRDLISEIARTYEDENLKSMKRTGWPRPPETLEVMGCQSTDYTCVKLISSNPQHGAQTGPTVTGTLLCTEFGSDQARLVCDASLLTPLRTAASTAFVMQQLVPEIETLGIIGAGREGTSHGFVLGMTLKRVKQIRFFDIEPRQSARATAEVRRLLERADATSGRRVELVDLPRERHNALFECDALVTATYGNEPVVVNTARRPVHAGMFIAAVGADLEQKRELDHTVYDDARFIVDDLAQSLSEGELQNAIGRFELQEARRDYENASGTRRYRGTLMDGRITSVSDFLKRRDAFIKRVEPITIYDSTGFSGQDLGLARLMLRLLEKRRRAWPPWAWNPPKDVMLADLLDTHGDSR